MRTVPIYRIGKDQAVCLPADMAYEGLEELAISRDGDVITLCPVRPSWASFLDLPKADDDFLKERPGVIGSENREK
ncbi:type II toxin-antitoxin system VapB family antitoxin [Vreelandella rituensis]|uniref:AbrB family transcriptional regulator n=1 Tax=Vreelandella rituensis TaxID=2282306 RepID=A0A368UAY2_9GAMM|nr:type II toxin-antitoxin system VapB family antitoxin [Halomonas rituensis]RCV93412.1 AbrB family transcriptional regulator [Halomonas rituensis]